MEERICISFEVKQSKYVRQQNEDSLVPVLAEPLSFDICMHVVG